MTLQTLVNLSPEPDLCPLYPCTSHIALLLSSHSGLSHSQKNEFVAHCLNRSCVFADIVVLQHLLSEPTARSHVDLGQHDEDGIGLVSLTIHGFGAGSDRDMEREECIRLLVSEGANLLADKEGWTPLHYATLLSPPTLVSYLMTHGCSPFAVTQRNLMPLDIVTAHSILPGRADVALLLEEAMRGQGWVGGHIDQKRRSFEKRLKRLKTHQEVRDGINKVLEINPTWWSSHPDVLSSDSESDDDDDSDLIYTPTPDYSSMLVFDPASLPYIFDSLITKFEPSSRDSTPANMLYLLARFACLTCDHTWLEDLIIGATDAIEETFFERADDVTCLVFWLYNTTIWLHLLQCDNAINEACEMLGSFDIIEEVINSVFVFVIRFAERRIDQVLDMALLDFTPLTSKIQSIQFESDWSIFWRFKSKKRVASSATLPRTKASYSPSSPESPIVTSQSHGAISSSSSRGFSSLKFARNRGTLTPLTSLFPDSSPTPSPADLTSFLTALHALLTLSHINPVLTTQLWSQVFYWTSCELFNRIITRKKYLCRSRATQIGLNVSFLEEWIDDVDLPPGIRLHFLPLRDLLKWLQKLSSITDFSMLVDTIQTTKGVNPLQMRRAARDYRYEVNESRMTEECIQYLTQLQKDWERHRVKLGVEALRKEIDDQGREESPSSSNDDVSNPPIGPISTTPNLTESFPNQNVDTLFGGPQDILAWEPIGPPPVLGELRDSRFMLPLLFPSDPRKLSAIPRGYPLSVECCDPRVEIDVEDKSKTSDHTLSWKFRNRKLREVGANVLQWVDGIWSAAPWAKPSDQDGARGQDYSFQSDHETTDVEELNYRITPLTRKPSGRGKSRFSLGGTPTTAI